MPQPLSSVNPQADVILGNAGAREIRERPELALLAMEVISSWSAVESFMLRLYVQLCGGNGALAAKIYLSLESDSPKSAALSQAIESIADETTRNVTRAIVFLCKVQKKKRDKIAHHIWGYSRRIPDGLLLANPKDLLDDKLRIDSIYVYKAADFESEIQTNYRLCGHGLRLQFILRGHVANRGGELLTKLCNEPEVAERLRLQARQAGNNP